MGKTHGLIVGSIAGVIVLLGAPLVSAQTPPGNNTIYACVQHGSQQVRIVGATVPCRRPEIRVSWNIVGPQGERGPQGPKGDTGDTGAQGAPGVIGPKGDKGDKGDKGESKAAAPACGAGACPACS